MAVPTLPSQPLDRRAVCTAALLLTLACGAAPAWAGPDSEFDLAIKSYRAGRWSDAYGKLIPLANNGNAQAARIVLFMYAHGPLLYGTAWDASVEDIELWSRLSGERAARQPGYDPLPPNPPSSPPLAQAPAQQTRTAYRPRMTRFISRDEQTAKAR
jgi:hypothetical protein